MYKVKIEYDRYHTVYKISRMLTVYFENRVKMQKCHGIKRRRCLFSILWYFTKYRTVLLTVNDPTRHHWRCRGEVVIWRLTILRFRIKEETDSDERERSRSDARKERGFPAWRRQVKKMTTEEMNESSWSTYLLKKGQNYDDVVVIAHKEKKRQTYTASLGWYRSEK